MGLDMYLSARLYTSKYSHKEAYEKLAQLELPGVTIPKPYIENFGTFQIEVPIAYWRKANQIHAWFVENVQEGRDERQTSYVSVDNLRELNTVCIETFMARNAAVAAEKLPVRSGFFFGGTDYDKYYWEDLRETYDALTKLLADIDSGKLEGWEFYYQASW